MTKLLKSHREAIASKILVAGRMAREATIEHTERRLALRLTKQRYGDDVFERCRALPEGWLHVHKTIGFGYYGNIHSRLGFPNAAVQQPPSRARCGSGSSPLIVHYNLSLESAVPLPNSFAATWNHEHLGALYDEVYARFASVVALHEEQRQLRVQVQGALAAFSTVEALADGWPEGYAHFPQESLNPASMMTNLPAVRLDDLNARLAAFREAA